MEIELLVRAIIENQGRFLIAQTEGATNTYLPGGHIEIGEAMKDALARELEEELGVAVEVGEYLGAVEHAWEAGGVHNHEINHCFVVTSSEWRADRKPISQEDHIEFSWLSPPEFDAHNLQPESLRRLLSKWEKGTNPIWWGSTMELRNT